MILFSQQKNMTVEIYVLALMKFVDDKVVFSADEVNKIEKEIFDGNEIFKKIPGDGVSNLQYRILKHHFKELEQSLKESIKSLRNLNIEFYYYHHRVIIKYTFETESKSPLRDIRDKIKDYSCKLIISEIVQKVNGLVDKKAINEKGKIILFYTYTLILLPKNKYQFNRLVDKLGSLSFKIIESTVFYGREHYIRISIPNMIVYYNRKISNDLKLDLIHAIYQYCLYYKKLDDLDSIRDIVAFDEKELEEHNRLDERLLTTLWTHITDSLGGKVSDNQMRKISRVLFFLTIVTVILTVLGLFISLASVL
ncbi:MAG TPA: hypothetical protein VHT96_12810 [Clostridia bacterium]|nr:hypothetical protein [Clostridia bacterium]